MKILIVTATRGDSPWFESTLEGIAFLRGCGVPLLWVVIGPGDKVSSYENRSEIDRVLCEGGRGLYAALNQAILEMARYDWTHFTYINDDDGLMPGFFELYNQALKSSFDVYYGDIDFVDAYGKKIGAVSIARNPEDCFPLFTRGIAPYSQQGMLMSRVLLERIGFFDLRFSHVADAFLWVRCYEVGACFCYVREVCAFYRIREGQLSNAVDLMREQSVLVTAYAMKIRSISRWEVFRSLCRFRFSNFMSVICRFGRVGFRSTRSMFGAGVIVR
jgi:GT2 family glycosyltransferase